MTFKMYLAIVALSLALLALGAAPASATGASDVAAIRGILSTYHSPLPAVTIEAFAAAHPGWDIAGYLTVMWCESSLGMAGRLNNPGSIKGGPKGTVWGDLPIGRTRSGYSIFASMYDGQRAAIRLLYDRGYMPALSEHAWWTFAWRYYGRGVPGIGKYVRNLAAAHSIIVRLAATYGANW